MRKKRRELEEEIRTHLEMARKERIERGESPQEAESGARAEFGNVLLVKEVTGDVLGWTAFETAAQDLKYGFRQMRRSPAFCAIVLVTLAFGIGANTTIFSIVNAILFQPIHARDPAQIVAVFSSVNRDALYGSSSYPDYVDIRDRTADTFQELAALTLTPIDLRLGDRAQHMGAGIVSGNYFRLLGAGALLGRTFAPDEDQLLDPRSVVVLGESTWRERFSADPFIAGKTVRINKQSFTVIGVVADKYCRLRQFFEVGVFVPAAAKDLLGGQPGSLRSRKARQFFLLGRRAEGISLRQAQAKLRLVAAQLYRDPPGAITVVSEQDSRVPPQARLGVVAFSIFLLAMTGTVLLIACTNLANLLLARALSRRTEIAVRVSVGASRWRLVRQLLIESFLLSAMGSGLALLISREAIGMLKAWRPPAEISLALDLAIDGKVLLFALLATVVTTLLFGLAPALHATGGDVMSALKDAPAAGRNRRFSFRNFLIVAEVAMSIVLLMPSGLFLHSLRNFRDLDIGFRRDHLDLVSLTLDPDRYSPERGKQAFADIAARLRRVPGVEQADLASSVPLSGMSNTHPFMRPGEDGAVRVAEFNTVGPRYFETMGIPFLRGRGFEGTGRQHPVAVVNRAFAQAFWPGGDALGRQVVMQGEPANPIEIIGVVGTGKYASMTETPTPYLYRPIEQEYGPSAIFHVRTKVPPGTILNALAREIQAYDPALPVFDARTMEDQLAFSVAPYEALAFVLGIFGALAVAISFAGLYGLIAYQTAVRTREIGVRMALGARPAEILAMMAKQGLRLVAIGIAIGVPVSMGVGLLIAKFLFGVSPLDPATYVAVPVVMGVVAVAAIAVPAVRGMKIDPWRALRNA